MNKIVNQRYSSDYQLPSQKNSPLHHNLNPKHRKSHAAADLLHKESQIELVKKRISALCVREQKYTHKTVNSDLQMQKKAIVQMQSMKIQRLLQQQRQRQAKQLQILKHRNLKTRADNYYRTKAFKQKRLEEIKQKSVVIRSRSQDNHSTISQNKAESMSTKKGKCQEIYFSQKKGQTARSRLLMNRREEVINQELKEQEHLHKLQSIKDYQLRELGKLQLMMVEKSNTSRAAYEASRDRLNSRTSKSRFQTHQIIRTARERKPSRHNISLNFY